VFESMVLKKMFGSGGRKEQDALLCMFHEFYSSANTVRVKKIKEFGRACLMQGGEEKGINGFGSETKRKT